MEKYTQEEGGTKSKPSKEKQTENRKCGNRLYHERNPYAMTQIC